MKTRRQFTAEFKAKVALEAIAASGGFRAGDQITQWKRQAIENLAKAFDDRTSDAQVGREEVSLSLSWRCRVMQDLSTHCPDERPSTKTSTHRKSRAWTGRT